MKVPFELQEASTLADEKLLAAVKKALEKAPDRNFNESVEVAINLKDIDLTKPDNRVDQEILLPNGRGRLMKIGVFGSGDLALQAKKKADLLIEPEQITELADDKKRARQLAEEHDFFIAEPPLMPVIGRELGAILGPKGKMPMPFTPNMDLGNTVDSLKNTVRIRSRDKKTFHAPIGTVDMGPEKISENLETVIKRITDDLEKGSQNIRSVYIKTTMGPAIRVR